MTSANDRITNFYISIHRKYLKSYYVKKFDIEFLLEFLLLLINSIFCMSKILLLKYQVTQRLKMHVEIRPSKQSFKF